ncbi:hypothetical protein BOVA514_2628 [Bacteroides ovatus]|nr:hypothetical protein BOVA514_2628 [Bacteroides ovatus]
MYIQLKFKLKKRVTKIEISMKLNGDSVLKTNRLPLFLFLL